MEVRGALLAALRDRTEIMQGETGCYFANRFIFCYQIFGRLFIYQGQGLAPHDISVLNGGNGEQSQDLQWIYRPENVQNGWKIWLRLSLPD